MKPTSELSLIGESRWSRAANALTLFRIATAPLLAGLIVYRNPMS